MRRLHPATVAVGLSIFFVVCTALWILRDRYPPTWDDAWYLARSLALYDSLTEHGIFAYGKQMLHALGPKAPLIAALPTPVYLILGRNYLFAYSVDLFSMCILFGCVYVIARRIAGARAGIISIAICGTIPLLYGLSRYYLVEFPLAAVVASTMALLFALEDRDSPSLWLMLGFTCGLGLLLKVTFPLYALPALAFAGWTRRHKRLYRRFWLAFVPMVVLSFPWYARNWASAVWRAYSAGFLEEGARYGTGNALSTGAVVRYLAQIARSVSIYYVGLTAAVLVILAVMKLMGIRRANADTNARLYLLCWMAPFLVFLFGANKDVRFLAPLIPGAAIAVACAVDSAAGKQWFSSPSLCIVLLFPLAAMIETSFGCFDRRLNPNLRALLTASAPYTRIYDGRSWPNQQVIALIDSASASMPAYSPVLLVASDTAALNGNNLELSALSRHSQVRVLTSAYEPDLVGALHLLDAADYVVYKDGGERESPFFNQYRPALLGELGGRSEFTEIGFPAASPDGGTIHFFRLHPNVRRLRPGLLLKSGFVHVSQMEPATVDAQFGDMFRLTGLTFERTGNGLRVAYKWRCTHKPDRNYWCFTHVIGNDHRIIGYLDHPILAGMRDGAELKPGDEAVEELQWSAPNETLADFQLRLGVFDQISGERLPIRGAPSSARLGLTVTDAGTALVATASGLLPQRN